MTPIAQAGHEHHERIREHVDRLPALADMLEERPVPPEFSERFAKEYDFMTGTLWPHVQVVEQNVYPELERLQQNRHSMAHLRREHVELGELIESMGGYMDRVEANALNPTDALGLRRLIIRFYATVKTHVAEEEEYLRVLQANLSEGEQESVEHGLEHASSE
ncbi:MAG: hemerythrin domain-containing protein [Chloroflexota bacterium]|jgi:iron-sulfur cluster repair protein YtfE (RIC family)